MKKYILILLSVISMLYGQVIAQVTPPAGWGDFQVGLVNDNTNLINVRMKKALSEGVKLSSRYIYVNNGVDPATNALSWLFNQWGTDYSKNSIDMGLRPSYVIYMLQEEGGAVALKNNILNTTFMRNYFLSIRTVAEKSNGYKAMFVIEPDTWGYFLQNALEQGLQSDPRLIPANVNNLGAGYEYLSDLPNTLSGVALAVIRTLHRYAPDSYCGLLMSFWSVNANGATGPAVPDGAKGMVYWNQGDVDYSANRNVTFANQLLGSTGDRGNFIGVEKNGWSAGNWLVKQGRNDYYWNDTQNAKWISWSKTLRQGVNLPLLGWQISIGHMGLPNTVNRYEDTFMPYFFTHVSQFIDAGFIGFLAGKGLADCTDFTNLNGNELEANGSAGDDGWFFEKLKTFDAGRPYIGSVSNPAPTTSITAPANGATFTAPASITINANASDTAPGTVSKVDFYNGTTLLGTDTSSPYSFSWTNVAAGTYTLTTKATDNQGAVGTSAAFTITVNTANNPAPTTSITSPANGATFTAPASVTINANATDTSPGTVSKVDFYNGTTLLGTDTSSPYSFAWSSVAAGTYTLTTKATDNQGAVGTSAAITITVNGTNPVPTTSITSPANGATFTAPASVTINANAADTAPGTVSKVDFYNGTTLLGTDTSSPYSFSWTNVAAGTYTLTTKATDNQGAVGTSAAITITVNTASNPAPTTSITSPANAATFTAPASVTINANASDTAPGTVSKVDFYNGTTLLGTDTSSPYSFAWTNVAAGTYTLTTKATDNQGAVGTSAAITITVSGGTGTCTGKPQYVENGGYVAGSQVQNVGSLYECKPYPFTGWCNGAAWAYAPGTGAYWSDAWILKGSCSARTAQPDQTETTTSSSNKVTLYPKPGVSGKENELTILFDKQQDHVAIKVINTKGTSVIQNSYRDVKTKLNVTMPAMSAGLYLIRIQGDHGTWIEKYVIHD